jgi:hypothetical protein
VAGGDGKRAGRRSESYPEQTRARLARRRPRGRPRTAGRSSAGTTRMCRRSVGFPERSSSANVSGSAALPSTEGDRMLLEAASLPSASRIGSGRLSLLGAFRFAPLTIRRLPRRVPAVGVFRPWAPVLRPWQHWSGRATPARRGRTWRDGWRSCSLPPLMPRSRAAPAAPNVTGDGRPSRATFSPRFASRHDRAARSTKLAQGRQGAPVAMGRVCESLGGNWGYPGVHGIPSETLNSKYTICTNYRRTAAVLRSRSGAGGRSNAQNHHPV